MGKGLQLSLVLDGLPHPLLIVYLVLEVIMGLLAALLIRKNTAQPA